MDRVLDSESDEPPNLRTLLVLFLVSVCVNTTVGAAIDHDTIVDDKNVEVVEEAGIAGRIFLGECNVNVEDLPQTICLFNISVSGKVFHSFDA